MNPRKQAINLIVNDCFNFHWFHNTNIVNNNEGFQEFSLNCICIEPLKKLCDRLFYVF